jgi:hypothetical protein
MPRDLYTMGDDPAVTARWLDQLTEDLAESAVPELGGMARTLRRWRGHILAWHDTGASNGPAEATNLLIKNINESGTGSGVRQLPATRPALHRRPQLGSPRALTPLKREEPGCRGSATAERCGTRN